MKTNYEYLTSVAGVKFANEDGVNRQEVIANICKGNKKGEFKFIASLVPTTFVNSQNVTENAIAVYAGKDQIGFIPRKDIAMMTGKKSVVAMAGYYEPADAYTVTLYEHEAPSSKQYSYAKRICNEHCWEMPKLYTRQAYTAFLVNYEKTVAPDNAKA